MGNTLLRIRRLKKLPALALAIALVFQDGAALWANAMPAASGPSTTGKGSASSGLPLWQDVISNPSLLPVPAQTAELRRIIPARSRESGPARLIILFEDPHSNFGGQENLAKTLDYFFSSYPARTVFVEGASGDATLTDLKAKASPKAWRIVAKRALIEGKVSGEEYLNLVSDHPMKVWGMEDDGLYREGLRLYAGLAERRDEIDAELSRLGHLAEAVKSRLYPKELIEYERTKRDRSDEAVSPVVDLKKSAVTDSARYPNLSVLIRLREAEKRIDFDRLNREQSELLALWERSTGEMMAMDAGKDGEEWAFRLNRVSRLLENGKKSGLTQDVFVETNRYIEYLRLFLDLDPEAIERESTSLEDEFYADHIGGDERLRDIRFLDRWIELIRKGVHLRLNRAEWEDLSGSADQSVAAAAHFNRVIAEKGHYESIVSYPEALEGSSGEIRSFYESVERRDGAFVRNIRAGMERWGESAAFAVAGGYHSEHLARLLSDEGFAVAVLRPKVTHETDIARYEKMLLLAAQRHSADSGDATSRRTIRVEAVAKSPERIQDLLDQASRISVPKKRLDSPSRTKLLAGSRLSEEEAGFLPAERIRERLDATTVVLMAGGKGERLGMGIKSAIPLGPYTLYDRALEGLKRLGVRKVLVVTPPGRTNLAAETERRYAGAMKIEFLETTEGSGFHAAAMNALERVAASGSDRALILSADNLMHIRATGEALYRNIRRGVIVADREGPGGLRLQTDNSGRVISRTADYSTDGPYPTGWLIPSEDIRAIRDASLASLEDWLARTQIGWHAVQAAYPAEVGGSFNLNHPADYSVLQDYLTEHPSPAGYEGFDGREDPVVGAMPAQESTRPLIWIRDARNRIWLMTAALILPVIIFATRASGDGLYNPFSAFVVSAAALAGGALLSVYGVINAWVAIDIWREKRSADSRPAVLSDERLPRLSVVVPVKNERPGLVRRTLEQIAATDYPRDRVEVILVSAADGPQSESATAAYTAIAEELSGRINVRHLPVLMSRSVTNGKAYLLNRAIGEMTGEYLIIEDADSGIQKRDFRTMAEEAARIGDEAGETVGAIQFARKNDPALTEQAGPFFASLRRNLHDILLDEWVTAARFRAGFIGNFGHANLLSLEAVRRVGGFSVDQKIEDLDIAFKLHDAGYGVHFSRAVWSREGIALGLQGFLKRLLTIGRGDTNLGLARIGWIWRSPSFDLTEKLHQSGHLLRSVMTTLLLAATTFWSSSLWFGWDAGLRGEAVVWMGMLAALILPSLHFFHHQPVIVFSTALRLIFAGRIHDGLDLALRYPSQYLFLLATNISIAYGTIRLVFEGGREEFKPTPKSADELRGEAIPLHYWIGMAWTGVVAGSYLMSLWSLGYWGSVAGLMGYTALSMLYQYLYPQVAEEAGARLAASAVDRPSAAANPWLRRLERASFFLGNIPLKILYRAGLLNLAQATDLMYEQHVRLGFAKPDETDGFSRWAVGPFVAGTFSINGKKDGVKDGATPWHPIRFWRRYGMDALSLYARWIWRGIKRRTGILAKGECFLCEERMPLVESPWRWKGRDGEYALVPNPFPLRMNPDDRHFVLAHGTHTGLALNADRIADLANLAAELGAGYTVFKNGVGAGASIPQHDHAQVISSILPLLDESRFHPRRLLRSGLVTEYAVENYPVPMLVWESAVEHRAELALWLWRERVAELTRAGTPFNIEWALSPSGQRIRASIQVHRPDKPSPFTGAPQVSGLLVLPQTDPQGRPYELADRFRVRGPNLGDGEGVRRAISEVNDFLRATVEPMSPTHDPYRAPAIAPERVELNIGGETLVLPNAGDAARGEFIFSLSREANAAPGFFVQGEVNGDRREIILSSVWIEPETPEESLRFNSVLYGLMDELSRRLSRPEVTGSYSVRLINVTNPYVLAIARRLFEPETLEIQLSPEAEWRSVDMTELVRNNGPIQVAVTRNQTVALVSVDESGSFRLTDGGGNPSEVLAARFGLTVSGTGLRVVERDSRQKVRYLTLQRAIQVRGRLSGARLAQTDASGDGESGNQELIEIARSIFESDVLPVLKIYGLEDQAPGTFDRLTDILTQTEAPSNSVGFTDDEHNRVQLELIQKLIDRVIQRKIERGRSLDIVIAELGLGDTFMEGSGLKEAFENALARRKITPAGANASLSIAAIDLSRRNVSTANAVVRQWQIASTKKDGGSPEFAVDARVANGMDAHALLEVAAGDVVHSRKADLILMRHTGPMYFSNAAQSGAFDLNRPENRTPERIASTIIAWLLVRNLLYAFANPESAYFVMEPNRSLGKPVGDGLEAARPFQFPGLNPIRMSEFDGDLKSFLGNIRNRVRLDGSRALEKSVANTGTGIFAVSAGSENDFLVSFERFVRQYISEAGSRLSTADRDRTALETIVHDFPIYESLTPLSGGYGPVEYLSMKDPRINSRAFLERSTTVSSQSQLPPVFSSSAAGAGENQPVKAIYTSEDRLLYVDRLSGDGLVSSVPFFDCTAVCVLGRRDGQDPALAFAHGISLDYPGFGATRSGAYASDVVRFMKSKGFDPADLEVVIWTNPEMRARVVQSDDLAALQTAGVRITLLRADKSPGDGLRLLVSRDGITAALTDEKRNEPSQVRAGPEGAPLIARYDWGSGLAADSKGVTLLEVPPASRLSQNTEERLTEEIKKDPVLSPFLIQEGIPQNAKEIASQNTRLLLDADEAGGIFYKIGRSNMLWEPTHELYYGNSDAFVLTEARVLAGLKSLSADGRVPELMGIGVTQSEGEAHYFIKMRTLAGGFVSAGSAAWRSLAPAERLDLIERLADTLDEMHRAGWVHNDIWPGNFLLLAGAAVSGKVGGIRGMLIDFGHSVRSGTSDGTQNLWNYPRIPDQTRTPASDIFMLGWMIRNMDFGFDGAELDALAERMLASEPSARPAMAEVLQTLKEQREKAGPGANSPPDLLPLSDLRVASADDSGVESFVGRMKNPRSGSVWDYLVVRNSSGEEREGSISIDRQKWADLFFQRPVARGEPFRIWDQAARGYQEFVWGRNIWEQSDRVHIYFRLAPGQKHVWDIKSAESTGSRLSARLEPDSLADLVRERMGNRRVADLGGDDRFLPEVMDRIRDSGIEFDEAASLSLNRIIQFDPSGAGPPRIVAQQKLVGRLLREDLNDGWMHRFSLITLNAPLLKAGTYAGRRAFADGLRYLIAPRGRVLARFHRDDVITGRIHNFLSLLAEPAGDGGLDEKAGADGLAATEAGSGDRFLPLVPTGFWLHPPADYPATGYIPAITQSPILEFEQRGPLTQDERENLAAQITGAIEQTHNLNGYEVAVAVLAYLRPDVERVRPAVQAGLDRFGQSLSPGVRQMARSLIRRDGDETAARLAESSPAVAGVLGDPNLFERFLRATEGIEAERAAVDWAASVTRDLRLSRRVLSHRLHKALAVINRSAILKGIVFESSEANHIDPDRRLLAPFQIEETQENVSDQGPVTVYFVRPLARDAAEVTRWHGWSSHYDNHVVGNLTALESEDGDMMARIHGWQETWVALYPQSQSAQMIRLKEKLLNRGYRSLDTAARIAMLKKGLAAHEVEHESRRRMLDFDRAEARRLDSSAYRVESEVADVEESLAEYRSMRDGDDDHILALLLYRAADGQESAGRVLRFLAGAETDAQMVDWIKAFVELAPEIRKQKITQAYRRAEVRWLDLNRGILAPARLAASEPAVRLTFESYRRINTALSHIAEVGGYKSNWYELSIREILESGVALSPSFVQKRLAAMEEEGDWSGYARLRLAAERGANADKSWLIGVFRKWLESSPGYPGNIFLNTLSSFAAYLIEPGEISDLAFLKDYLKLFPAGQTDAVAIAAAIRSGVIRDAADLNEIWEDFVVPAGSGYVEGLLIAAIDKGLISDARAVEGYLSDPRLAGRIQPGRILERSVDRGIAPSAAYFAKAIHTAAMNKEWANYGDWVLAATRAGNMSGPELSLHLSNFAKLNLWNIYLKILAEAKLAGLSFPDISPLQPLGRLWDRTGKYDYIAGIERAIRSGLITDKQGLMDALALTSRQPNQKTYTILDSGALTAIVRVAVEKGVLAGKDDLGDIAGRFIGDTDKFGRVIYGMETGLLDPGSSEFDAELDRVLNGMVARGYVVEYFHTLETAVRRGFLTNPEVLGRHLNQVVPVDPAWRRAHWSESVILMIQAGYIRDESALSDLMDQAARFELAGESHRIFAAAMQKGIITDAASLARMTERFARVSGTVVLTGPLITEAIESGVVRDPDSFDAVLRLAERRNADAGWQVSVYASAAAAGILRQDESTAQKILQISERHSISAYAAAALLEVSEAFGDVDRERVASEMTRVLERAAALNQEADRADQRIDLDSFGEHLLPAVANLMAISEPVASQALSQYLAGRQYLPMLKDFLRTFAFLTVDEVRVMRGFYRGTGRKYQTSATGFNPVQFMTALVGYLEAYKALGMDLDLFESDLKEAFKVGGPAEKLMAGRVLQKIAETFDYSAALSEDSIEGRDVLAEWNVRYLGLLIAARSLWTDRERGLFDLLIQSAIEGRQEGLTDPSAYERVPWSVYGTARQEQVVRIRRHNLKLLSEAESLGVRVRDWVRPGEIMPPQDVRPEGVARRPLSVIIGDFNQALGRFRSWAGEKEWAALLKALGIAKLEPFDTNRLPGKEQLIQKIKLPGFLARIQNKYRRQQGAVAPEILEMERILDEIRDFDPSVEPDEEVARVRFWNRNMSRDAFLGNEAGSCTSLGANASAIFEFLLDQGTQYVVAEDADGRVKGYARFFLGISEDGMAGLYIDSVDGVQIPDVYEEYIRAFAAKVGIAPDRVWNRGGQILEKVGGGLTDGYFHHSTAEILESYTDESADEWEPSGGWDRSATSSEERVNLAPSPSLTPPSRPTPTMPGIAASRLALAPAGRVPQKSDRITAVLADYIWHRGQESGRRTRERQSGGERPATDRRQFVAGIAGSGGLIAASERSIAREPEAAGIDVGNIRDRALRRWAEGIQTTLGFLNQSEEIMAEDGLDQEGFERRVQDLLLGSLIIWRAENPHDLLIQSGGGPAGGVYQMEGATAIDEIRGALAQPKSDPRRKLVEAFPVNPDTLRTVSRMRSSVSRHQIQMRDLLAKDPALQFLTWRLYVQRTARAIPSGAVEWAEYHAETYNTAYYLDLRRLNRGETPQKIRRGLAIPEKTRTAAALAEWMLSHPEKDWVERQAPIALELARRESDLRQLLAGYTNLTRALRQVRDSEKSLNGLRGELAKNSGSAEKVNQIQKHIRGQAEALLALDRRGGDGALTRVRTQIESLRKRSPEGLSDAQWKRGVDDLVRAFQTIHSGAQRLIEKASQSNRDADRILRAGSGSRLASRMGPVGRWIESVFEKYRVWARGREEAAVRSEIDQIESFARALGHVALGEHRDLSIPDSILRIFGSSSDFFLRRFDYPSLAGGHQARAIEILTEVRLRGGSQSVADYLSITRKSWLDSSGIRRSTVRLGYEQQVGGKIRQSVSHVFARMLDEDHLRRLILAFVSNGNSQNERDVAVRMLPLNTGASSHRLMIEVRPPDSDPSIRLRLTANTHDFGRLIIITSIARAFYLKHLARAASRTHPKNHGLYLVRRTGVGEGGVDQMRGLITDESGSRLAIFGGLSDYKDWQPYGKGGMSRVFVGVSKDDGSEVIAKFANREEVAPVIEREGAVSEILAIEPQVARWIPELIGRGRATEADAGILEGVHPGDPFVIRGMGYGESVRGHIQSIRSHSNRSIEAVEVLREIARAISAFHTPRESWAAVYHRDLKPEDILVRKSGFQWKVLFVDWGLASIEGLTVPAPEYDFSESGMNQIRIKEEGEEHPLSLFGTDDYSGRYIGYSEYRDLRAFQSIVRDYSRAMKRGSPEGEFLHQIELKGNGFRSIDPYLRELDLFMNSRRFSGARMAYATKSFPVRHPDLYALVFDYIDRHKEAAGSLRLSLLGAGIDEVSLGSDPVSPQVVELLAALEGRSARLRVYDGDAGALAAVKSPGKYRWYGHPESGRSVRGAFKDSPSYDRMRRALSVVLTGSTDEDFKKENMSMSNPKLFEVNEGRLTSAQIETVHSDFAQISDYGDETEDLLISTIAVGYALRDLDRDAREALLGRMARALKPGALMILHKDDFGEAHPDIRNYRVDLRSDDIYRYGFKDIERILKLKTGRDFSARLFGQLIAIERLEPVVQKTAAGSHPGLRTWFRALIKRWFGAQKSAARLAGRIKGRGESPGVIPINLDQKENARPKAPVSASAPSVTDAGLAANPQIPPARAEFSAGWNELRPEDQGVIRNIVRNRARLVSAASIPLEVSGGRLALFSITGSTLPSVTFWTAPNGRALGSPVSFAVSELREDDQAELMLALEKKSAQPVRIQPPSDALAAFRSEDRVVRHVGRILSRMTAGTVSSPQAFGVRIDLRSYAASDGDGAYFEQNIRLFTAALDALRRDYGINILTELTGDDALQSAAANLGLANAVLPAGIRAIDLRSMAEIRDLKAVSEARNAPLDLNRGFLPLKSSEANQGQFGALPVRATVYLAAAMALSDRAVEAGDPVFWAARELSGNPVEGFDPAYLNAVRVGRKVDTQILQKAEAFAIGESLKLGWQEYLDFVRRSLESARTAA